MTLKNGQFCIFGAKSFKGLISETVELERNFGITKENKHLTENFQFWSGELEKTDYSAFLAQQGLISETERARAKRTTFLDHQVERTYSMQ